MQSIHFGTGGWRALIGDDFNKENIYRFAQGLAEKIKSDNLDDKPVVIGYDRRFLSEDASRWLAQVLCANGIAVQLLKRSAPTPLIMHTVKKNNYNFGLEVTASHNPSSFNGIKIIVQEGRDASVEVTGAIEDVINKTVIEQVKSISLNEAETTGLLTYIKNPFNDYLDDILGKIDVKTIRNRGLRIAFDPMHGSGLYSMMVVLCTSRCTVDLIHQNKDAYFGSSNPAPSPETLSELRNMVIRGKYDLGIAFDGDGDRIGIIDPTGEYIDANSILLMLYWYLHEFKKWKGPVVRNNSTTHILDVMAESFNEKCYEVPVGFKWVSAKIDETDAILGGESSGGLTVRGHIFGKDSTYAASLFVEMLSSTGMTPKQIIDMIHQKYGKTVILEETIKLSSDVKEQVSEKILKNRILPDLKSYGIDHVSYEDGCKIYFNDNSFAICRFSGTEPLLRLCAEAKNEKTARDYLEAFKNLI